MTELALHQDLFLLIAVVGGSLGFAASVAISDRRRRRAERSSGAEISTTDDR